jgi:AP2-like factor, ANT lineage
LDRNYPPGLVLERKIDLSNYIKWWAPKKSCQSEATTSSNPSVEDLASEIKSIESASSANEPFKLPSLGVSHTTKPNSLSACDILSQSDAFKNFLERSSKVQEEKDGGGAVPVSLCVSGPELQLQSGMPYSLTNLLSAPLRPNWSAMDPCDPLFWTNVVSSPLAQPLATLVSILSTFHLELFHAIPMKHQSIAHMFMISNISLCLMRYATSTPPFFQSYINFFLLPSKIRGVNWSYFKSMRK